MFLTAMESDLIVGGQAVMEGVMMRTPSAYAIACRKKDGTIVHTAESLPKWSDKYKWINLPVLRGGATLIQSMALGVKALNFSAQVAHEDMEAEKAATVKAEEFQTESALAEGTIDEEFYESSGENHDAGKSSTKRKSQDQTVAGGGRGRLDNFRAVFQCSAFCRRAARFDEYFVYFGWLGGAACFERRRVVACKW